jgi:hypothetical protein
LRCAVIYIDNLIAVGIFLNRFKSVFVKAQFAVLCLACALFGLACAQNKNDDSDSSSEHHHHHGGGSRGSGNGNGQGGFFNRPDSSGSPSPVPGQ